MMPFQMASQRRPQQPQSPAVPQPQLGAGSEPPTPPEAGGDDQDMIQHLADTWGIPMEEAALKLQQMRAEALMNTQTPQGRKVGDVFVASNPLEVAGAGIRQGLGAREMRRLPDQYRALGERTGEDAASAYRGYRKGQNPLFPFGF